MTPIDYELLDNTISKNVEKWNVANYKVIQQTIDNKTTFSFEYKEDKENKEDF